MARLRSFLDQALASHGQVAFVVGEAGSGKTALLREFAHRAQQAHEELVFAIGNCNAQTGVGDAYLPFREILAQLTGDVEARLTRGAFTSENTRRLTGMAHLTLELVAEFGPDLVGTLVPGARLLAKAGSFAAKKVGWLDKLQKLVDSKAGLAPGTALEQGRNFEQFTNVLKGLTARRPLVLVLDDLQWADAASTSLLFHLGRRLEGSRLLVLGAYRPEEVELGRGGERHPLEKVLAEFKRYFGDVWVDLDQAEKQEARQFVDALLDTEPNRLGESFRQALVNYTGGHPLFATELLRAMQERKNLEQDAEGRWVVGPSLDWDALPPRVEGVIEERIGRLHEPLQETLKVACVEGETFTAEVIARVQNIADRTVVGRLSNELDQRHYLVMALGTRRLGTQLLSSYRFRHNLFQKYLYNSLDLTQRTYSHQDVGKALEALYGEEAGEIALQLAWHFQEAAIWDKAVCYLSQAAEQARLRYAHEEAIANSRRALALLREHPEAAGPQHAATLHEGLGDVLNVTGQSAGARSAYTDALALAPATDRIAQARLQRKIGKTWERERHHPEALRAYGLAQAMLGQQPAEAATDWWHEWVAIQIDRIWTSFWNWGEYPELSEMAEKVQAAVEQYGTPAQRSSFFRSLVLINSRPDPRAPDPRTESYARAAVAASEESGNLGEIAQSRYYLGLFHMWFKNSAEALDEVQSALALAERIGDPYLQLECLSMLAVVHRMRGEVDETRRLISRSLPLATELGSVEYEGMAKANLAWMAWRNGDLDEAQRYARAALDLWQTPVDMGWHGLALWPLIAIALTRDELSTAIDYVRRLFGRTQRPVPGALAEVLQQTIVAWDARKPDAARVQLEQALELAHTQGYL